MEPFILFTDCRRDSPGIGSPAGLFPCLEVDQISLSLDCLPPHPDVEAAHDGHREVEGQHGAQQGHHPAGLHELDVAILLVEVTLVLNVGPGVDGSDPHYTGQGPGAGDEHDGLHGGPGGAVGQRPGH